MTADAYADAVPLAGRLDPETGAPSPEGTYRYPFHQPSRHTEAMAILRYLNSGGGGWGDPLERDPERVRIDVRDGYVSVEGAARDYGVVVLGDPDHDPENLTIEYDATKRLRAERRR